MTVIGVVGLVLGTLWSLARELQDVRLDALTRRAVGFPELTVAVGLLLTGPHLVELLT